MTMKRQDSKPKVILSLWKKDGALYYADKADLEDAIRSSGACEKRLRLRLGAGYNNLLALLEGKRVDGWQAQFIKDAFFRPHFQEKDRFPIS